MSLKNTKTTSDYIEWDKAINLIHRLYNDGEYRLSLLIGCGIFFGLRISDILSLNWDMILNKDSFEIQEKKTKKHREVRINKAIKLIESGEYSITQIAYMVGINDPRYFSKCFKQKMGMTPTEYRDHKGEK